MVADDEPIPISALEHFEYCPRQCALILVDGLWAENEFTVSGQRFHRRADEAPDSVNKTKTVLRGLALWSDRLGLMGRADIVEVDGQTVVPVEYKAGTVHGMAAHVQLCAQAFCLEEMFHVSVTAGALWLGQHRRRIPVAIDGELRRYTLDVIEAVRQVRADRILPPAVDDERCVNCQLRPACLPEVVSGMPSVKEYFADASAGRLR